MTGIGFGMIKQLLTISMAIAGLVSILSLADIVLQVPFGRASIVMDILFFISGGIVLFLGYDSFKDLK